MTGRVFAAAFLAFICVASLVVSGGARAQSNGTIFINADGSVSGSDAITRNGNFYILTDNLCNTSIVVLCDNITLDGGGHTLQGPGDWPTPAAINLTCTGVTVENFVVEFWEVGILGVYDGNTIRNNSIIGNERDIAIYADNYQVEDNYIAQGDYCIRVIGNNSTFTRNNFDASLVAFWITDSSGILITENRITVHNPMVFTTDYGGFQVYHNNFYNVRWNIDVLSTNLNATSEMFPSWDNGYASGGNYWSDYSDKYPNATEIDHSGIGNTPYEVTTNYAWGSTWSSLTPNLTVQDRYPLMSPFNIPNLPTEPNESPQPALSPPASTNSLTKAIAESGGPQKSAQQNDATPELVAVLAVIAAVFLVMLVIVRASLRPQPRQQ